MREKIVYALDFYESWIYEYKRLYKFKFSFEQTSVNFQIIYVF